MAAAGKFACALVSLMVFALWFALSPTRESRKYLSSSKFSHNTRGSESAGHHKYTLSLALDLGTTFKIEEESLQTATTRNMRGSQHKVFEILAQTSYRTHVELEMKVVEVLPDSIRFQATMLDFLGYEKQGEEEEEEPNISNPRTNNDEDDEHDDHDSGYNAHELQKKPGGMREMFEKVREETRFVQFGVVLALDGTVLELETSKLRAKIISGLHEAGQLPMHLEHAILVGGYDVYPVNGASFGPLGRTKIRGPVFMLKGGGFGCSANTGDGDLGSKYKGRIVVVDRGGCTFHEKAELAAQLDAVALIVIDRDSNQDEVSTYMSGEGDVSIVSVIGNADAGEAIERAMRADAQFVSVGDTELYSSGQYVVEILGGLEAVKALNSQNFEDVDEVDGETIATHAINLKSHHLNPVHPDGLNDYVGIGYLLDEIIRNRFSIFPDQPVAIGQSWDRTLLVSDKINPDLRAEVKERFKLASVSRAEEDFAFGKRGDLIAEIHFSQREAPVKPAGEEARGKKDGASSRKKQEEAAPPATAAAAPPMPTITPQFGRPSLRGHSFSTEGVFQIHLATGLVFSGSSTSSSSSVRNVVIDNQVSKKLNSVKAKVTLQAETTYKGTLVV